MIKIASEHSYPLGSTVALVNLCNQLNARGYSCVFYGPDYWHMDKCRSGKLQDFKPEDGDIVLLHDIEILSFTDLYSLSTLTSAGNKNNIWKKLKCMIADSFFPAPRQEKFRLFLTCQQDDSYRKIATRYSLFDKIHFASKAQNNYSKWPKFYCQNFLADLKPSPTKPDKVAGIIGSIDKDSGTAQAIEMALQDGMNTVILYGYLAAPIYFYEEIIPLTKTYPGKIKFAGFLDNQQQMYDSVSDVYSSVSKPWSTVRRECILTNTRFHCPEVCTDENMTNDSIFEVWKNELEL